MASASVASLSSSSALSLCGSPFAGLGVAFDAEVLSGLVKCVEQIVVVWGVSVSVVMRAHFIRQAIGFEIGGGFLEEFGSTRAPFAKRSARIASSPRSARRFQS